MTEQMIDVSKIPKLQFELHNQQLRSCIKQLHFHSKTQEKVLEKIRKNVDLKVGQASYSQSLRFVSSFIDINSSLLKQLPKANEPIQQQSQFKTSTNKLGSKMGQISGSLGLLFTKMSSIENKMSTFQDKCKTLISQKASSIQSQLTQFRKSQTNENRKINQDIQLNLNSFEDKLREVQTKTLWQINDCQNKLVDRVNDQFVKDLVKESQGRVMTKVKENMIKSNIDPQRIDDLETNLMKLSKEIDVKMVQNRAKIQELNNHVDISLVSKKDVSDEKINNQKVFGILQNSLAELNKRAKNLQTSQKDIKEGIFKSNIMREEQQKRVNRLEKLVTNLKLGDDFMKLMQSLDPHKLCQMDNRIDNLVQKDLKIEKELDLLKRYTQKLKDKVQICNMLNPNDKSGEVNKEQVEKLFGELINAHPVIKKMPSIEGQLYEFKVYGEVINEINKKINKIRKQFDLQNVIYMVKGLQEYTKKELLIVNTKLSTIQGTLQDRKRRPLSASRRTSDGKLTSCVSYKKLTPVDCISCFQNPMQKTIMNRRY